MLYDLTVRSKEPILNRATLVSAFAGLGEKLIDDADITDTVVDGWLPKKGPLEGWLKALARTQGELKMDKALSLPNPDLPAKIGKATQAPINPIKKLKEPPSQRLRLQVITTGIGGWRDTIPPTSLESERMARLAVKLKAAEKMKGAFPFYSQQGYASLDAFINGHKWTFSSVDKSASAPLLCTPRRFQYNLRVPILLNGKLAMNFYPVQDAPPDIQSLNIRQIVESDSKYYGASTVKKPQTP